MTPARAPDAGSVLDGLVLALDASTYVGTVAVLRGGSVVLAREARMRGEHEERLLPAVAESLQLAGASPADVDAVVCGAGPGSFTSLRIAASIAKGLATSRVIPLYAVPSLALVVAGAVPPLAPGRYLASLDAMRGERFAQLVVVETEGTVRADGESHRVPADRIEALARELSATAVGPGAAREAMPHARGVAPLLPSLRAGASVSLDAWEPDYGRLAEAQVKWEAAHGRPLSAG
jgi:tRNA threonylcarbamoyladenosine biosynthesis protein TsaB